MHVFGHKQNNWTTVLKIAINKRLKDFVNFIWNQPDWCIRKALTKEPYRQQAKINQSKVYRKIYWMILHLGFIKCVFPINWTHLMFKYVSGLSRLYYSDYAEVSYSLERWWPFCGTVYYELKIILFFPVSKVTDLWALVLISNLHERNWMKSAHLKDLMFLFVGPEAQPRKMFSYNQ